MTDPHSERRVRIISQGFNTWRVQVLFQNSNLPGTEISERLREVKEELALQFGVPNTSLEYTELISKKATRHGLLVQIRIVKQDFPAGAPIFRTGPGATEDGNTFSDMRLEADLFPFDQFEQPLTRATIEARLTQEGFDLGCIRWSVVAEALRKLEFTRLPISGLEIGFGKIPGLGNPSRLTYGIPRSHEHWQVSAWHGVRPVARDEFLVEVSSPSAGMNWGRNVYGRELESKPGIQTRLIAGGGVKLVAHGTRLIANRDGMLIFERTGKDKRDRDTCDLVPVRLMAEVRSYETVTEVTESELLMTRPAAIMTFIPPGTRIRSTHPLFILGDLEEGVELHSTESIRIAGDIRRAKVTTGRHLCITGNAFESALRAEWTLQVDGAVEDSSLYGADVIVSEITGGSVEALRQTSISKINDHGDRAASICINLRKHLENQQVAGKDALVDLHQSLTQIFEIFGPDIALNVTESSAQRMLLQWLRQQKTKGAPNYTQAEVRELRTVLEMIPLLKEQVKAIGSELQDITAQLERSTPEPDAESDPVPSTSD